MQPPSEPYVVPPPGSAKTSRVVTIVISAILGTALLSCLLLIALLYPAFVRARQAARRNVAISRLKQLAIAVEMFENDHNDSLPDMKDQRTFRIMVDRYLSPRGFLGTTARTYNDPISGKPFAMNAALSHADESAIEEAADVPFAFQPEPRNGQRIVAFVDGHVRSLAEVQFQQAMEHTKGFKYVLGPLEGKWRFPTNRGATAEIEFAQGGKTVLTIIGDSTKRTGAGFATFDASDNLEVKPDDSATKSLFPRLGGTVQWESINAFELRMTEGSLPFKRVAPNPRAAS